MGYVAPNLATLIFQITAALLFALVFLFLWRQSKIVYFGLWSAAWAAKCIAVPLAQEYLARLSIGRLAPFALFEFAFTVLVFAAGAAGFSGPIRNWRSPLKVVLGFPILLGLVFALSWQTHPRNWQALNTAMLSVAYFYNYTGIRTLGTAGRTFRFVLLGMSAAYLYDAVVLTYVSVHASSAAGWTHMLGYSRLSVRALQATLSFSAMAMWIEYQQQRMKELGAQLERVRPESSRNPDLDDLTGLLNHAALDRRIQDTPDFDGVMVVCDIDNFKEVNDRYGHLAGDEILRSIGHLFHASIRQEDEAFRWGGDEFAILFRNQGAELVNQRMRDLRGRLQGFRVRGYGVLPISFSYGIAQLNGRPLREVLDEADRKMYQHKGTRR
jgi:diguanylate cyclase (GGDEF)-like protein